MRCRKCRKEIESGRTAYFLDRSTISDLCSECANKLEQDDLESAVKDAIEVLCNAANRAGNTEPLADALLYGMSRQHRYLQNRLFMALHHFFVKYSKQDRYDDRNAWAVSAAKNWEKHSFDNDSLDNTD